MEQKISFSEQPLRTKILYGVVVGVLCLSAVTVGIIAAASRQKPETPVKDPVNQTDTDGENKTGTNTDGKDTEKDTEKDTKTVSYVFPLEGTVAVGYSLTVPVFSDTLGEWRVHTGVDISAEDGAAVCAAAEGIVSTVKDDPMLGKTVEITHPDGTVTGYSNLRAELAEGIAVGTSVKAGDTIGTVGDTSVSELGAEPHLHFCVKVNGEYADPMRILSEENR